MPISPHDDADTDPVGGRDSHSRAFFWGEYHLVAHLIVTGMLLVAAAALTIALLTGPPLRRKTVHARHIPGHRRSATVAFAMAAHPSSTWVAGRAAQRMGGLMLHPASIAANRLANGRAPDIVDDVRTFTECYLATL